jgi:CheY-like chemotaxis protein
LVKAIRQNPLHASLLVAMVTTEGSHEAVASAKAAGADGHLSKPFSVASLRRLIHRLESGNGWA